MIRERTGSTTFSPRQSRRRRVRAKQSYQQRSRAMGARLVADHL